MSTFYLAIAWVWANIFKLGLLVTIGIYMRKIIEFFIIQPLQGDDNRTSMNELAKFIVLSCLVWTIYANGVRENEWQPYSDTTIATLTAGVFSIAAINPLSKMIARRKEDDEIEPIEK